MAIEALELQPVEPHLPAVPGRNHRVMDGQGPHATGRHPRAQRVLARPRVAVRVQDVRPHLADGAKLGGDPRCVPLVLHSPDHSDSRAGPLRGDRLDDGGVRADHGHLDVAVQITQ